MFLVITAIGVVFKGHQKDTGPICWKTPAGVQRCTSLDEVPTQAAQYLCRQGGFVLPGGCELINTGTHNGGIPFGFPMKQPEKRYRQERNTRAQAPRWLCGVLAWRGNVLLENGRMTETTHCKVGQSSLAMPQWIVPTLPQEQAVQIPQQVGKFG